MTTGKAILWSAGAFVALVAWANPQSALGQSSQFYPLTPCRVVDTRATGTTPPTMTGNSTRSFTVKGLCGVPSDAKAIAYNLTAVLPSAGGHMRIFPSDVSMPTASAVNFSAGTVTANGGVVKLATTTPDLSIFLNTGTADALVDVTGYFK